MKTFIEACVIFLDEVDKKRDCDCAEALNNMILLSWITTAFYTVGIRMEIDYKDLQVLAERRLKYWAKYDDIIKELSNTNEVAVYEQK